MKTTMILAITLGLLSTHVMATGRSTGNGGDIIECSPSRTNNLRGKYFLDYVITHQRNQQDIVNVNSWEESRDRIQNELNRINPYLARHFQNFTEHVDNYTDYTKNYVWEEHAFGVVNIQDENITTIIPANCLVMRQRRIPVVNTQTNTSESTFSRHDVYLQNRYGTTQGYIDEETTSSTSRDEVTFENRLVPTAKLSQLIVRTIRGNNTTVFEYDPDRDTLRQTQPLQFSYAMVHEWLWEFTHDVNLIRRVNRLLHSQHLSGISDLDQFDMHTLGLSADSNYLGLIANPYDSLSEAVRIPLAILQREDAYHALYGMAAGGNAQNFMNKYRETGALGLNIQNPSEKLYQILSRSEYSALRNYLNHNPGRIGVTTFGAPNLRRALLETFSINIFNTAVRYGSINILNLYKENRLPTLSNYLDATRAIDAANLPAETKNAIRLLLTQIFSGDQNARGVIPDNFSLARTTESLQSVYDVFLKDQAIVINAKFFEYAKVLAETNSLDLYRQVIQSANIVEAAHLAQLINDLFAVNKELDEENNQRLLSSHIQFLEILLANKTRAYLQNVRFSLNIIPFLTTKGRLPLLRVLDRATGLVGAGVRGNLNQCTSQDIGANPEALLGIFNINPYDIYRNDRETIHYVFANYNLGCNVLSRYDITTFNFLGSRSYPFDTNSSSYNAYFVLIAGTNLKMKILELIAPRMSFTSEDHQSMIYFKRRMTAICDYENLGNCQTIRISAMQALRQSCHSFFEEKEGRLRAARSKRRYCDNWLDN